MTLDELEQKIAEAKAAGASGDVQVYIETADVELWTLNGVHYQNVTLFDEAHFSPGYWIPGSAGETVKKALVLS